MEFDVSKPVGNRVRSLSILCTRCRVPQYEPVQDDGLYTVVLPSYLVTGGDGFVVIQNEMKKHSSGENPAHSHWVNRFGPPLLTRFCWFFQVIWTFPWCPVTSQGGGGFIRLWRDASRSTTRPVDSSSRSSHWFHWFYCSRYGAGEGASGAPIRTQPEPIHFGFYMWHSVRTDVILFSVSNLPNVSCEGNRRCTTSHNH